MAGLRIAIIGAGPSGVVAVKALLAENKAFALIKVFERRDRAGGAWNYTPNDVQVQKKPVSIPSLDPRDVDPPIHLTDHHGSRESQTWPSPMYHRLNTNIPAELMAYHESPFPQQTELFPNRETVLMYLQDYASVVSHYISFGREVLSVIKPVNSDAWSVTSRAVSGKTEEVETFDRVIVASGHYETPKIPDIPGLKSLDDLQPEVVRHSKYYRTPAEYHGKKTVVVGSGPSGADIADQIAEVASLPVIRSTRSQTAAPILERPEVRDVGEIQCVKEDRSVKLKSGEIIEDVERILFCTGYLYSFPFLNLGTDERERLISDGERVRNLYEQIFYIPDPTIAFLAMGMSTYNDSSRIPSLMRARYRAVSNGGSTSLLYC